MELLEPEGPDAHAQLDPLAAMVGIGTATEAPDDPALARLLPDAYGEDADASAEFRRYTELSLREKKQAQARAGPRRRCPTPIAVSSPRRRSTPGCGR